MSNLTVRDGVDPVPYWITGDGGKAEPSAMPADVMRELLRRKAWAHEPLACAYACGDMSVDDSYIEEVRHGRP